MAGSSKTVLRLVARGPPTGNGQPKTGKLKDWKQSLCDTSEGGSKYAKFWEKATFWKYATFSGICYSFEICSIFGDILHFGNMLHFGIMLYFGSILHLSIFQFLEVVSIWKYITFMNTSILGNMLYYLLLCYIFWSLLLVSFGGGLWPNLPIVNVRNSTVNLIWSVSK